MHKKGKIDCTIYTVLRLRRRLTRGQKAEKGKEYVASAINRAEAEHMPARRSNQGARARLDRESAPSRYKRETGRHEINKKPPAERRGEILINHHLKGKYPTIEYFTFIPVLGIFIS